MATEAIVGREDELHAIEAFVVRGTEGPAALVLEGEPGIGKTTLWLAGLDPSELLLVPRTLEGLVRERLQSLDSDTRDGLLAVAALGRLSPRLLESAGVGGAVIEAAVAADVIELSDDEVRFTHPLLASAV
jgi:hypothetical protein